MQSPNKLAWATLLGGAATFLIGIGIQIGDFTDASWGAGLIFGGVLLAVVGGVVWFFAQSQAGQNPQPDTPVHLAIDYIVNDSRARLQRSAAPIVMQTGPAKGRTVKMHGAEHADAIQQLNEALASAQLSAWGARSLKPDSESDFESHLRPIDRSYWNDYMLHLLMALAPTSRYAQTMVIPQHTKSDFLYSRVTLSSDELRRLWKPMPLWLRAWRKLARAQRITYGR